ncbi:toxin biosynthesis cytochrome P450 monooxygenase [Usnea florida]
MGGENNVNYSGILNILSTAAGWILVVSITATFARVLLSAIYNIYFHPLRNFPGPKLAAATPLPFVWRLLNGRMVPWTMKLHAKYGVAVRVLPDELSFIGSSAWQDIYTARPQLPKPTFGVLETPNGIPTMGTIPDAENHGRQRKIISHAFSDRALLSQEYILQKYSDLLIERLRDQPNLQDGSLDICSWYNFTTFDITGDLCFGESFHSLETAENHPWVAATFKGVKAAQLLTVFHHFPPMSTIVKWCIPQWVHDEAQKSFTFTRERVDKRIASKSDRPDFMKYILENNYSGGLSKEQIDSTTTLLVLAGSETSATTLTSATYFALKNPPVMRRLVQEVKQAFKKQGDITIAAVSDLPYLHAVIQEALRMHPTGPISVPRQVDRPDVDVCGMAVPQGIRVGIPQKTAFRSPTNFVDPDTYIPERWLKDADSRFAKDDKAVFEPFMVGPRNCIGKTLAWVEMKMILAKVLWNFDLELSERMRGKDWSDQLVFLLNEKTPMYVRMSPRA